VSAISVEKWKGAHMSSNFGGPFSKENGKQQRSWKVLENDDNVMEFLQLN